MEADNTHTILINLVNVCTDDLCQPQEITRNPVRYKHITRQTLTQNRNTAVMQCCILKVNPSQCRQCRTLYITGFTTFVNNNATTTATTAFTSFSFTWSSFLQSNCTSGSVSKSKPLECVQYASQARFLLIN